MVIILSEEDKLRISNKEISYDDLIKEKGQKAEKQQPRHEPESSELDEIKKMLKEANAKYREAIVENRRLRNEVKENVKTKRECIALIASLREKKKKLKNERN